jgi:hypothetical protein
MSYRESLSVAWLICWRTFMFFLGPVVVVSVLSHQPLEFENSLRGWLLTSMSELLIFYFWIVEGALGKIYSRFSLSLERSALKNV